MRVSLTNIEKMRDDSGKPMYAGKRKRKNALPKKKTSLRENIMTSMRAASGGGQKGLPLGKNFQGLREEGKTCGMDRGVSIRPEKIFAPGGRRRGDKPGN